MGRLFALAAMAVIAAPGAAAAAPPANDDFAGAVELVAGDNLYGSTYEASSEPGEPDHAGDPGGASVWYSWTAPRSIEVYMQACAIGGWSALVGVYRGSSLAGLAPVASSSSQPGETCREFRFRVTAHVAYRIAVDGYAGGASEPDRGDFFLSLRPMNFAVPPNDMFADATAIGSEEYARISGTTEGATREPGEPALGGPEGASVWYRWTAPQSAAMRIHPCTANFRPVLALYTGSGSSANR